MRLRVLGCSGGIGGRHLRTTSFLVDTDVLIDAGSGVGDLSLAELAQIDHIFVTHSHLDHVTSIPFLVDTVGGMRNRPLTVYAAGPTIEILKNHLFNWAIWPDFTEIPTAEAPIMRYQEVELARTVTASAEGEAVKPRATLFRNIVHTLNHNYVIDSIFRAHALGVRRQPAQPHLQTRSSGVVAVEQRGAV